MFEQPDYDFQPSDFVWCAIGVLGAGNTPNLVRNPALLGPLFTPGIEISRC